jgi:hypothetical protein
MLAFNCISNLVSVLVATCLSTVIGLSVALEFTVTLLKHYLVCLNLFIYLDAHSVV